jgi:hypothetical protein
VKSIIPVKLSRLELPTGFYIVYSAYLLGNEKPTFKNTTSLSPHPPGLCAIDRENHRVSVVWGNTVRPWRVGTGNRTVPTETPLSW